MTAPSSPPTAPGGLATAAGAAGRRLVRADFHHLCPSLFEIADSLQRERVVRHQTDIGAFWLPADDAVITPWFSYHGSWEQDEAALLRDLLGPGMVALDVGANVGYRTCSATHASGLER